MFSVCCPCAQLACMATTAAAASATLGGGATRPGWVRHRYFHETILEHLPVHATSDIAFAYTYTSTNFEVHYLSYNHVAFITMYV
jgi:hypothetical protein